MIKNFRDEIDLIDDQIKTLILKRMDLCRQIALEKSKLGQNIENLEREKQIIDRQINNLAKDEAQFLKELYQKIFELSKDYQTKFLKKNAVGGLIGENVTKSLSKQIHNYFETEYNLYSINKQDIRSFLETYQGDFLNVTMPFKTMVIPYLDGIIGEAEKIGVINTIVFQKGKKWGYNTDIKGLEYVFTKNKVKVFDKNVLILGTGATSKSAEFVMKKLGAKKVYAIGRFTLTNYTNYQELGGINIIINTTPVGMNGYESLIDLAKFSSIEFVADVVYTPFRTKLILDAQKLGIKCAGGLDMLISQAYYSEMLIKDVSNFSLEPIKKSLSYLKQNIVLIGMPGAGKSNIAKILAKNLGLNYVDTDYEIYKKYNQSPEELILSKGEKFFRKVESQVVSSLQSEKGLCIATGGGVAVCELNLNLLKQNGIVFYINRPISLLSTKNRPLSQKEGVEKLYKMRHELYKNGCDYVVDNDKDINSCVKRIMEIYEKSTSN